MRFNIFTSFFIFFWGFFLYAQVPEIAKTSDNKKNSPLELSTIHFPDGQNIEGELLEIEETKKLLWQATHLEQKLEFQKIAPSTSISFRNISPHVGQSSNKSTYITLIDNQTFFGEIKSLSSEFIDFQANETSLKIPTHLVQKIIRPFSLNTKNLTDLKPKFSQIGIWDGETPSQWFLNDETLTCLGSGIINLPLGKRDSCIVEFDLELPNPQKDTFSIFFSTKDKIEKSTPITDQVPEVNILPTISSYEQLNTIRLTYSSPLLVFPLSNQFAALFITNEKNYQHHPKNYLRGLQSSNSTKFKIRLIINLKENDISLQIDGKAFLQARGSFNFGEISLLAKNLNLHFLATTGVKNSPVKIKNLRISEYFKESMPKAGEEFLLTSTNQRISNPKIQFQNGNILVAKTEIKPNEIVEWTRNRPAIPATFPQIYLISGQHFRIESLKQKDDKNYLVKTPFGELTLSKENIAKILYSEQK